MKNIEVIITNVTDNVFDHVAHVEESIEALGALYNYTKRESLEPLFNKKIRYVQLEFYFISFYTIGFIFCRSINYLLMKFVMLKMK